MLKSVGYFDSKVDRPLLVDPNTGKCGMWTLPELKSRWVEGDDLSEDDLDAEQLFESSRSNAFRAKLLVSTMVEDFGYNPDSNNDRRTSDRILDVGCRDGEVAIRLAMLGGWVDALDPCSKNLASLTDNLNNDNKLRAVEDELMGMVGWERGKRIDRANVAKRIRLRNGEDLRKQYDAIVMNMQDQWVETGFLWEDMAKMLKPGGAIFVVTTLPGKKEEPNLFLAAWNRYVDDEMKKGVQYKLGEPKNVNVMTHLPTMRKMVKSLGLEVSQVYEYDEWPGVTPDEYVDRLSGIVREDILAFLERVDGSVPEIGEVQRSVREKMYSVAIERDAERRNKLVAKSNGNISTMEQEPRIDVLTRERVGIIEVTKDLL